MQRNKVRRKGGERLCFERTLFDVFFSLLIVTCIAQNIVPDTLCAASSDAPR